jgi:hypothetical protein
MGKRILRTEVLLLIFLQMQSVCARQLARGHLFLPVMCLTINTSKYGLV